MRRLFIAINIPEDIKDRIAKKNNDLEAILPSARYTGREKWHLTVVFLGWQPDEAIIPIIESMNAAAREFSAPEIVLSDISYGPMEGMARMVWLNGSKETSETVSPLKTFLEDELIKKGVRFKLENRKFNAHVTLNRFSNISKKDRPELGKEFENLNWIFEARSLDLMESHPSPKGAKYEVLQQIKFGG
jgi:2'-5' RNA ligase